jgi:hypothetical protein
MKLKTLLLIFILYAPFANAYIAYTLINDDSTCNSYKIIVVDSYGEYLLLDQESLYNHIDTGSEVWGKDGEDLRTFRTFMTIEDAYGNETEVYIVNYDMSKQDAIEHCFR